MKGIIINAPTNYIVFENGGKMRAEKVIRWLEGMVDEEYTEFIIHDDDNRGFYELVKSECKSEIKEVRDISDTRKRIYWNYMNGEPIEALIDKVYGIVEALMKESGVYRDESAYCSDK